MRFGEWLVINEMSALVSGPFQFFHGTSTGVNNDVLQAFRQQGARPVGGGWGQGGGFYVFTQIEPAKKHALERMSGSYTAKTTSEGRPMVVVVEVPQLDFTSWDLDLEAHSRDILSYASKKVGRLNKLGSVPLSAKSGQYLTQDDPNNPLLDKITGNNAEPVNFARIKKHSMAGSIGGSLPSKRFSLGDPLSPQYNADLNSSDTGIGSKLAPFYYAHQDASKGRHEKMEAWFFQKNYGKKNLLMKYTGQEALPVKQILVHDGQNWVSN